MTKRTNAVSQKATADTLEKTVSQIRRLQRSQTAALGSMVTAFIGIGDRLIALKATIDHGQWLSTLDELGYSARTSQRIMKLAASELGDRIRTAGADLAARLPTDLQALLALSGLSAKQLAAAVEEQDLSTMSRVKTNAVVAKYRPKPGTATIVDDELGDQNDQGDEGPEDEDPADDDQYEDLYDDEDNELVNEADDAETDSMSTIELVLDACDLLADSVHDFVDELTSCRSSQLMKQLHAALQRADEAIVAMIENVPHDDAIVSATTAFRGATQRTIEADVEDYDAI